MSDFCPKGWPCPVDKNFKSLEAAFRDDQKNLELIKGIGQLVAQMRINADCDGVITEQEILGSQSISRHCGSHVGVELVGIATNIGEECGFDPSLFAGITESRIR